MVEPCQLAEVRASLLVDILEKIRGRGITVMHIPACGLLYVVYPPEGDINVVVGGASFTINPKLEMQVYGENTRVVIPSILIYYLVEASREKSSFIERRERVN